MLHWAQYYVRRVSLCRRAIQTTSLVQRACRGPSGYYRGLDDPPPSAHPIPPLGLRFFSLALSPHSYRAAGWHDMIPLIPSPIPMQLCTLQVCTLCQIPEPLLHVHCISTLSVAVGASFVRYPETQQLVLRVVYLARQERSIHRFIRFGSRLMS